VRKTANSDQTDIYTLDKVFSTFLF